ncbi:FAD dependent oxidoreductase superfamily protein [Colletotrichum camelliae]|nr:FAD dependent oxidoreductase superfamily protein [Colletotrichum camelliae]
MVKVTILGAGVTGMMIAGSLPRHHDITIVAEYLPGDYDTKEWASPWAGAIWVGVHDSAPREQTMQLEGLMGLWRLAETNPESSVRQIKMTEIMDRGSKSEVWYAHKVPNFRFLSGQDLPEGTIYGMEYKTAVLTPQKFLLWLYERLRKRGIEFLRTRVSALADLKGLGHDVLINATGIGAETLVDVQEKNLVMNRLQCVVAKAPDTYNQLFIRRGHGGYYSTAFSRGDGTVYCGGVLTQEDRSLAVSEDQRNTICRNAHLNQPHVFPSPDPKDWPILHDHVGLYATMDSKVGGVRCEKETIDGQRVVHAYGQNAGGYGYSFGLAREVVRLTEDYLFELPASSKI